jgi:transposase
LGSSFQRSGADGPLNNRTSGPKPRLSPEQLAEFARIVERAPDREVDGVLRWRRIDLKRVIAERFGVDFHVRCVVKVLKKLGFSRMSARPRHPAQDERIVEAKTSKTSRAR